MGGSILYKVVRERGSPTEHQQEGEMVSCAIKIVRLEAQLCSLRASEPEQVTSILQDSVLSSRTGTVAPISQSVRIKGTTA